MALESTESAASPTEAAVIVGFNPRHLIELYSGGRFDDLSEEFLGVLTHFEQTPYITVSPKVQHFINVFVKHFLNLFTQPDYIISDRHVDSFLRQNPTISNLVAVSSFRTTDGYLEVLRVQEANFIKTLTLYSARNSAQFDCRKFLDLDPPRACLWYSMFSQSYVGGVVSETVCRNLRAHFEFDDARLNLTYEPQGPYFGSTYVDGECDRLVKPVVNRTYRRLAAVCRVQNAPDPRKIAVFSAFWSPVHSVYRNYAHYVAALRERYHLTLFQFGDIGLAIDESQFDEVRRFTDDAAGRIDVSPLLHNDFQAAYFPDIGMSLHSIVLANMRLAPVQFASPGHSVSTWGADIDYFISGADVEVAEDPERNYSERLVLLPGCGVIHNQPLYEPLGRAKSVSEFVINCPWTPQKVNFRFCRVLQRILDESRKPLRLRLFVGGLLQRRFSFVPFVRDLRSALRGGHVEVFANRPYAEYMSFMEEGDISIDSFHFGGCNTIADSLFLRIPTVTYEGDKWYNRIGSQMLRMVGTPELVATNDDEYVAIVTRLIHDDPFRREIHERLAAADLDATIFDTQGAGSFCETVDYLIANHERLSREPDRRALHYDRDIRRPV